MQNKIPNSQKVFTFYKIIMQKHGNLASFGLNVQMCFINLTLIFRSEISCQKWPCNFFPKMCFAFTLHLQVNFSSLTDIIS